MKVNKKLIEGFDEMTVEQQVQALLDFDMPTDNSEVERLREAVSRANSEASEWKKKHKALLSDEEKAQAEREEQFRTMSEELATLKKEKTISQYVSRYVALGYSEDLALETATAMAEGDAEKVFVNRQKFITDHDKNIQVNALQAMPKPAGGSPSSSRSKAEIMQIRDSSERQQAIRENIELFI